MTNLIVRNIDDAIVDALKARARRHGISAEAKHRRILEQELTRPKRKGFIEILNQIPNVGENSDFTRVRDEPVAKVFD